MPVLTGRLGADGALVALKALQTPETVRSLVAGSALGAHVALGPLRADRALVAGSSL